MANDHHKGLASFIKQVHFNLREQSKKIGFKEAWEQHLLELDVLKNYSSAMQTLGTHFWEDSAHDINKSAESRIQWTIDFCREYFFKIETINHHREKETKIHNQILGNQISEFNSLDLEHIQENRIIKLLDVGSCYNPFSGYDMFEVTAIDIAPANTSVFKCDFLGVEISNTPKKNWKQASNNEITELPVQYFHSVIFSLFLEYLPSSEQRLQCCRKAYDVLRPEGILIIITPDSKHIGANVKLMKNWRYVLGQIGFTRIRYCKLSHITCMVFRKALFRNVAERWSAIHRESYMTESLQIPQDFTRTIEYSESTSTPDYSTEGDIQELFCELPNTV